MGVVLPFRRPAASACPAPRPGPSPALAVSPLDGFEPEKGLEVWLRAGTPEAKLRVMRSSFRMRDIEPEECEVYVLPGSKRPMSDGLGYAVFRRCAKRRLLEASVVQVAGKDAKGAKGAVSALLKHVQPELIDPKLSLDRGYGIIWVEPVGDHMGFAVDVVRPRTFVEPVPDDEDDATPADREAAFWATADALPDDTEM